MPLLLLLLLLLCVCVGGWAPVPLGSPSRAASCLQASRAAASLLQQPESSCAQQRDAHQVT
jgi:hypothetical protein